MEMDKMDFPEGWEVVRLGDFATTEKGKKPKRISKEQTEEYAIPYVNIKAFEKGIIDEYTDGAGCILCDDDDFLMVWDGSRSGYVGKAIKGALGSTLVRIKFPEVNQDYAFYFLQSKFTEINTRAKGVGIPHVDPNLVWNYQFPLPPLAEQERIVAKIEELFSELDAGKAALQKAAQQLKNYRQAVLKWAFEGRLTNEHVVDGELPVGWEEVELGTLMASVRNGYSKKPDETGNYKILRISSVRPNCLDIEDTRCLMERLPEENEIQENDLLFTRYNGSREFVGVSAIVPKLDEPIFYPDKLIRCRPKLKDKMHSLFLQYATNYGKARSFVLSRIKTTAGQTGIAGAEIKQMPILLPRLEEQHRIVEEIEAKLSVCDKMEETIADSLQKAEALRQSILKKAFEGKLL